MKCWRLVEKSVSIACDKFAQWLRQFHYMQAFTGGKWIYLKENIITLRSYRQVQPWLVWIWTGLCYTWSKKISGVIIWEMNGWMDLGEKQYKRPFSAFVSVIIFLWTCETASSRIRWELTLPECILLAAQLPRWLDGQFLHSVLIFDGTPFGREILVSDMKYSMCCCHTGLSEDKGSCLYIYIYISFDCISLSTR